MQLKRDRDVMAEINITPLTDVLLVLLVIFMVTASAITQAGFNIKLPQATTQEDPHASEITISITRAQDIFVGHDKVAQVDLYGHLSKMASQHATHRVIINADKEVPYGSVVSVMDIARRAGLTSIGLSAERATR